VVTLKKEDLVELLENSGKEAADGQEREKGQFGDLHKFEKKELEVDGEIKPLLEQKEDESDEEESSDDEDEKELERQELANNKEIWGNDKKRFKIENWDDKVFDAEKVEETLAGDEDKMKRVEKQKEKVKKRKDEMRHYEEVLMKREQEESKDFEENTHQSNRVIDQNSYAGNTV
jgi:hypothetical protein